MACLSNEDFAVHCVLLLNFSLDTKIACMAMKVVFCTYRRHPNLNDIFMDG